MFDSLEKFINRLNDMDWGWRPFLALRPSKEQGMDNRRLLKLTLIYGSLTGVLFLLVFLIAATDALNGGEIIFAILFCLLAGWFLFFVFHKMIFAWAWNRRARRLCEQEGCDMLVEIFQLHREGAEWVIDPKQRVAVVKVKDGQGSFQVFDKSREAYLRKVFTEPASAFRGGGTNPDGSHFDAFVTHPAWTREALELIVNDKLRGQTLGGRLVVRGRQGGRVKDGL